MIYHCEQYSEEWWRLRNGKTTASMMWAIEKFCKPHTAEEKKVGRGKESADRSSYRERIVAQILCGYQGQADDEWKGKDVEWGKEFEATAVAQYEVANACSTQKIGFCTHERIPRFGCSPDRIVGTDGIMQVKCPRTTTHLAYRRAGAVPEEYEPQLVAEMACTGRQWADFVSFDPRLTNKDLQLFIVRLPRNERRIAQVEAAVEQFLAEIDADIASLTGPSLQQQLEASLAMVNHEGI